ncbi:MAG: YceI family protein [Piscirickettsiaceae bacterium]|nr:YceI family protein [Piscirickettsiaceae bacterium]
MNIKFTLIKSVFFLLFTLNSYASTWTIDLEHSQLNFVSIKKVHVAEVHTFNKFQGTLDEHGQFELVIDLASVDTNIELRDKRLGAFLFDITHYAKAKLTGTMDITDVTELAVAQSKLLIVDGMLNLHGEEKQVILQILVTRLSENKLLLISAQPVLINVADFSLVSGIEKLRELAKLPSISYTVPVNFHLLLNALN